MATTRKTPVGKPGTTKATGPASDGEFVFPSTRGEIRVQSLATARPNPYAFAEAKMDGDMARVMVLLTKSVASEEAQTVLRSLPADETGEFYRQWGEFSGITVGESSAS